MATQQLKDFIDPRKLDSLKNIIGSIISLLTAALTAIAAFQATFGGVQ